MIYGTASTWWKKYDLQPAEESTEEEYDRDLQDWEGNEKVENDSALLTGKNWESSEINRRTFQKKWNNVFPRWDTK